MGDGAKDRLTPRLRRASLVSPDVASPATVAADEEEHQRQDDESRDPDGRIDTSPRYAAAIMTNKSQLMGSIFATVTPAVEVRVP
ncbi:MAG: hypothetical protein M3P01_06125 [Actinomycetota bacterium]|nr:hypothetical protein [Actinomycetota bacterium]